jgi:DNA repair photolyase
MADKLKAIYRPNGEALEYAPYGLNLYGGRSHGCIYCYNQYRFHRSCNSLLKKATLENIEADLKVMRGNGEPVHLSFVGDPYDMAGRIIAIPGKSWSYFGNTIIPSKY